MPNDTMPIHIKNGNSYSGYNFITPTDTEDCIVTFTSSDNDATTAKTTDGMTSVATLESGETHESLFQKISKMFLNIRKLWNTVGETDISGVGQTVTGAITNLAPTLLYDNASGVTSGDINLSDSLTNYEYIDVVAMGTTTQGLNPKMYATITTRNYLGSNLYETTTSKHIQWFTDAGDYHYWIRLTTTNDTKLTFNINSCTRVLPSSPYVQTSTAYNQIFKIIGYKK